MIMQAGERARPIRPGGAGERARAARAGQNRRGAEALRRVSPQSACAPQALTLDRARPCRSWRSRSGGGRGAARDRDRRAERRGASAAGRDLWAAGPMAIGHPAARAGALPERRIRRWFHFYLAEAYRQDGRLDKAAREYRNTLRKLDVHPPGALLDGVAVGWLRETCQRQIEYLPRPR